MSADAAPDFDQPMTLAEARRCRDRIASGALQISEPHRAELLAWLTDEEIPRLERQVQAEGRDDG